LIYSNHTNFRLIYGICTNPHHRSRCFFILTTRKFNISLIEQAKRLIPEKALPQVSVFNVYCNQVTPLYFMSDIKLAGVRNYSFLKLKPFKVNFDENPLIHHHKSCPIIRFGMF